MSPYMVFSLNFDTQSKKSLTKWIWNYNESLGLKIQSLRFFLQEFEYTVIYNFYVELQATKEKSLAQRKFA